MSWTLIEHQALTSSVSSVTLGSGGTIPQTYKTLKIVMSVRADANNQGVRVRFNGDTGTNYSWRRLNGSGSGAQSDNNATYGSPYNTFIYFTYVNPSTYTASTFSNGELTIPNYTASTAKPTSSESVSETNATEAYQGLIAGLWTGTAAITYITLTVDGSANWVSGSTFTLYGLA